MRHFFFNLIFSYIIVGFTPINSFGECSIINPAYINYKEDTPLTIVLFYNNLIEGIDKSQTIDKVAREGSIPLALTVSINGMGTICEGESSIFTAVPSGGTGSYNYLWSTAETTVSINVSIPGTYTVTVTDNGTSEMANTSKTVTVNPKPVVNAGMDVAICKGTSTTLMANGSMGTPPYTYNWDNGLGAGQNHNVSPISTTTYSVTVTDFNLCTSTDNVIVTVNPKPVVNAGMDVAICKGTSTTLMANGSMGTPPYTYNWDNGLGAGQNHNVSPISTTTYSVTVTDFNLCTSTDNVIVTVNPKPVVNAGMDVAICKGTSTTLMANGSMGNPPYTYNWDNGLGAGQNHNVSLFQRQPIQ
ncbi:MAG: PKD domain-containing protein [Saprospiraceae bacterium]|nr:PKD domain-containing protein [Candidatus Vicinibacter affinis]